MLPLAQYMLKVSNGDTKIKSVVGVLLISTTAFMVILDQLLFVYMLVYAKICENETAWW